MEQWKKLCDGIWCKRYNGVWKIRHEFCDGAASEFEVSDKDFAFYRALTKEEKNSNKTETRRHISLNYLSEKGKDFAVADGEPLNVLIESEDEKEFWAWLSFLKPKQIEVLKMVLDGVTVTEIARLKGVSQQAISKQLKNIWQKIKVFSKKGCDLPFGVGIVGGNQSAYYELRSLRK